MAFQGKKGLNADEFTIKLHPTVVRLSKIKRTVNKFNKISSTEIAQEEQLGQKTSTDDFSEGPSSAV